MMKKILLVTTLFALAGCEQAYRYPCQDPANWTNAECQKPICEVNKDCPEYIFKDEPATGMAKQVTPRPPAVKGECK